MEAVDHLAVDRLAVEVVDHLEEVAVLRLQAPHHKPADKEEADLVQLADRVVSFFKTRYKTIINRSIALTYKIKFRIWIWRLRFK